MKNFCALSTLSVLLLMAGCASVDSQHAALASGAPCCKSLAETTPTRLSGEPVRLVITDADRVVNFSTGNSRSKVIDLGVYATQPRKLAVRPIWQVTNVYTNGGSWGPLFFSAVTFLDDRWQLIETHRSSTDDLKIASCRSGTVCSIGMIAVAVPHEARYLVVHTPYDMVGLTQFSPLNASTPGQTYMIGGSLVSFPGGAPAAARTIGMASGEVEIIPIP